MEKFKAYASIVVGILFLAVALFVQGAPGERALIALFGGYLLYYGIRTRDRKGARLP